VYIEQNRDGTVLVLTLRGDLLVRTVPQLASHIDRADLEGVTVVRLDVAGVERIDSRGIGALVGWFHHFSGASIGFHLVNMRDNVLQVLHLSNVKALLTINAESESPKERARLLRDALWDSHEYTEQIIAALGEGLVGLDCQGRVVFANPSAERILGWEEDEILGEELSKSIEMADSQGETFLPGSSPIEILTQSGKGRYRGEILVGPRRDLEKTPEQADRVGDPPSSGRLTPVEAIATPIFKRDVLVGVVVGLLDKTDKIAAGASLAKIEAQLRQSQKTEMIGQLTAGVAHDFNNLLQVVLGYTHLSLAKEHLDDETISNLNMIQTAGERATDLTRQLLGFNRGRKGEARNLDLNALVVNIMKLLSRVIGEDIAFGFVPDDQIGTVHADPGFIEQILLNLCVNARDAIAGRGYISVRTEDFLVNDLYHEYHPWTRPGRYALLWVSDDGCGMSRETQKRIFEAYYTTKDEGQGTGLGLATVRGLVEQLGGMIHVYSEPDQGSEFMVFFPVVEDTPAKTPKHSRRDPASHGGNETILVAEDDETVRSVCTRILERGGYTVLTAEDGGEAVALFEAKHREIDLVLLDVVMPRVTGPEAYERIKRIDPSKPVLFSSGYSHNTVHARAVMDEKLNLIRKPYRPDEMLQAVRDLLDGAHA
jgi:anti-anti-sigma factor